MRCSTRAGRGPWSGREAPMLRRRSPKGGAASIRAPAARGARAKRACSAARRVAPSASNRAPAARRTRAKRACPAGGAPSLGAQRQAAGAEPRPSDGRRCSPCRTAGPPEARPPGEARRPPRRTYPRSERSTQGVAPRAARTGGGRVAGPLYVQRAERGYTRLGGRGLRPLGAPRVAGCGWTAAWNVPSAGMYASAGAGLRPAGAPRVGLRFGMGYTVDHPMDAAPRQPLGAARQARALRLQDRLASLASCEPQAPVSRGSALRAPPAEHGRFAPAPRAAGARLDALGAARLAVEPWALRARSTGHGPRAPVWTHRGASRLVYGARSKLRFAPLPAPPVSPAWPGGAPSSGTPCPPRTAARPGASPARSR